MPLCRTARMRGDVDVSGAKARRDAEHAAPVSAEAAQLFDDLGGSLMNRRGHVQWRSIARKVPGIHCTFAGCALNPDDVHGTGQRCRTMVTAVQRLEDHDRPVAKAWQCRPCSLKGGGWTFPFRGRLPSQAVLTHLRTSSRRRPRAGLRGDVRVLLSGPFMVRECSVPLTASHDLCSPRGCTSVYASRSSPV